MIALDTNVLAYTVGVRRNPADDAKIDYARALIIALTRQAKLVVAVQALVELHNVLSKAGLSRGEAGEEVERVQTYAQAIPTEISTMTGALWLTQRHRFSIFDAVIMCASSDTGADWLLTEDMQDGFLWRTMRLLNPFALSLPDTLDRLGIAA